MKRNRTRIRDWTRATVQSGAAPHGFRRRTGTPRAWRHTNRWLGALLALLCLGVVSPLLAADARSAPAETNDTPQLQEVVVTATKRAEDIQKVPVSVYALTQQSLFLSNVKNMTDIAALVPGIDFTNQSGYGTGMLTMISIRGVNSDIGASTVGVYIDDTAVQDRLNQYTNFGNAYPVPFDLERVEVDRGPQGTLFGAGAEGGLVRFVFNEPDLEKTTGEVSTEVAHIDYGGISYETGLAVGGPIVTDTLGFRMSAWYRHYGGYINELDPFTGALTDPNADRTGTKAFRLALLGKFDGVTITPSIYYQSEAIHDATGLYGYLSDAGTGEFNAGHILPLPAEDTFYVAAMKVEADVGGAKLTSISSYFSRFGKTVDDLTGFAGTLGVTSAGAAGYGNPLGPEYPVSYSDATAEPNSTYQRILSQEVRLSSLGLDTRLTWVAGLFYSRANQDETENAYSTNIAETLGVVPPTISLQYTGTVSIDTQAAAFGQADYAITNRWKLTAGLRVADMKYSFETLAGGLFNAGAPPEATTETSEHPVTPKVALTFQADPQDLYYVSIGKGFRAGGGNSPLPTYCNASEPATFASDDLWSYEIGAKNRFLDNHVQMDTSAYHIDWTNIQQEVLLIQCGLNYIANTGKAKINGFDLSMNAIVLQRLKLGLAVSYTDSRYSKNVVLFGVPIVDSGDQVGGSPWNATMTGEYDFPLPGSVPAFVRAEEVYHSRNPGPFAWQIPGGISYDPETVTNPATHELFLRAGATLNRLQLSVFIDNATNSLPYLNHGTDVPASTLVYLTTLTPRTVGLDAVYQF